MKRQNAESRATKSKTGGQNSNSFLYNNETSVPQNKPEESAENYVVEHTTDEWTKPEIIEDIANWLNDCESLEMLAVLRKSDVPPSVFKEASRLLEAEKHQQIKEWVIQLNIVA